MIRIWECSEGYDGESCEPDEPCEGGGCQWAEYADLAALLAARWLTCAECEARSDDDASRGVPQWYADDYYCSAACVRKHKARQAKLRRARRDWLACLKHAGLDGHKAEYWGLCGGGSDGVDPHYCPTGNVHTPTCNLTLRLGGQADIAASLSQWHAATGLPIPALGTPQAQWMVMLQDWMDTEGVGRAEVAAWHAAQDALGLRARWGKP